ncbi:MAG: AbrB/MazE/SpoVT family DNA-binding domain-containing protein [Bacilli bacterium]
MKATGVIRRIDDLGRVVIPKEIRKSLRIKDGENLEIFVDDKENIILKKHSLMKKISDLAGDFADSIHIFTDKNVLEN